VSRTPSGRRRSRSEILDSLAPSEEAYHPIDGTCRTLGIRTKSRMSPFMDRTKHPQVSRYPTFGSLFEFTSAFLTKFDIHSIEKGIHRQFGFDVIKRYEIRRGRNARRTKPGPCGEQLFRTRPIGKAIFGRLTSDHRSSIAKHGSQTPMIHCNKRVRPLVGPPNRVRHHVIV